MRLMNYNFVSQDATVITASSTDASFPLSNLKNSIRSKRWRSTGVTSEWIVFDLVTTEPIDSVILMWPKEDGIRLSNTATIHIQANATNVWTSPAVDQVLTINNTYMLASYYFTSDQNYRYWRVTIQDSGNPYGFLEIGKVWLGKGIVIQPPQNGFTFDRIDNSVITRTKFQSQYADIYPKTTVLTFQYSYMDYSDMQLLDNAHEQNGSTQPVFISLDETSGVFDKDHFAVYGVFASDLQWTHVMYKIINSPQIAITEIN